MLPESFFSISLFFVHNPVSLVLPWSPLYQLSCIAGYSDIYSFLLKIASHITNWNIYKLLKKYLQQDNTRGSTWLTYYEESKVNTIINNNYKNMLMIFLTWFSFWCDLHFHFMMVCIFSNKKLIVFWNKQKGEPCTTKVNSQNVFNVSYM